MYKGGTCWLKNSAGVTKSDAIVNAEITSVCGIILTETASGNAVTRTSTNDADPCDQWELTDQPLKGDWAIMQTAARLVDIENTDAGSNYENLHLMWGYLEAKHNNFILARHQFGTASTSSLKTCEISQMGGSKNWAAEVAGLTLSTGLALATRGSALIVQTDGTTLSGLGAAALEMQKAFAKCQDGTLGVVWYPVSIGANTLPFNFKMKIVEIDSEFEYFYLDTQRSGDRWSKLDECWSESFKPTLIRGKECVQNVDLLTDVPVHSEAGGTPETKQTKLGEVSLESVIIAYVRGPLVEGEVQVPDISHNVVVERKSEYGPLSNGCMY